MSLCAFVHSAKYIPLEKRVVGRRVRIEPEWAIMCDLCEGMKEEFVDPEIGRTPQCIPTCPHFAVCLSTIEAEDNESRTDAIKRIFKLDNSTNI